MKRTIKVINDSNIEYVEYRDDNSYILMQECIMDKSCAPRIHDCGTPKYKEDFTFICKSRRDQSLFLVIRFRCDIGLDVEIIDINDLDTDKSNMMYMFSNNINKAINKLISSKKITHKKISKLQNSILKSTSKKKELINFRYDKILNFLELFKNDKNHLLYYEIKG